MDTKSTRYISCYAFGKEHRVKLELPERIKLRYENETFDLVTMRFLKEPIRIIVIGDSGVGKTCFIQCVTNRLTNVTQQTTIGCDYYVKRNVEIVDETGDTSFVVESVGIHDPAGSEKFHAVIPSFYTHTMGAIVLLSPDSLNSLKNIVYWTSCYEKYKPNNPHIYVMNKKDLLPDGEIPECATNTCKITKKIVSKVISDCGESLGIKNEADIHLVCTTTGKYKDYVNNEGETIIQGDGVDDALQLIVFKILVKKINYLHKLTTCKNKEHEALCYDFIKEFNLRQTISSSLERKSSTESNTAPSQSIDVSLTPPKSSDKRNKSTFFSFC